MNLSLPYRIAGAVVLAGLVLWIVVDARSCHAAHQATSAKAQADQFHEGAVASAAEGRVHDGEAEEKGRQVQVDGDEVVRLRAEVARLRHPTSAGAQSAGTEASSTESQPVGAGVDLVALVGKQDALIAAQDKQITDLKAQTVSLTLARDSWKSSAEQSAQEAAKLRIALAAQEALARAEYWRGFWHGVAIGGSAGGAAGAYAGVRVR